MAIWNKKKTTSKLNEFFKEKGITYTIEEGAQEIIKFDVCLKEANIMVYPYITLDAIEGIASFNVNVASYSLKNYDLKKLNDFNSKSKFFKAYMTASGIVVLEYRFYISDLITTILNTLIENLFTLQNEIDKL